MDKTLCANTFDAVSTQVFRSRQVREQRNTRFGVPRLLPTGERNSNALSWLLRRNHIISCYNASATVFHKENWTMLALMGGGLAAGATYTAKYIWDNCVQDFVFPLDPNQEPVYLHGVDVTGHQLLLDSEVVRAADFAAVKHAHQTRQTGEAYVTHCVETGRLVSCLVPPGGGLRSRQAVVAGILHDTLDDTDTTEEELTTHFGPEVCALVLAVTRLSSVNQMLRRHRREHGTGTAEWSAYEQHTLRSLVLGIVDDPRAVLIKLADRLHNMRTVHALTNLKQAAFAQETLTLWCSVAARLGMFALKAELEDLCFAVLQPRAFVTIQHDLHHLWSSNQQTQDAQTQAFFPGSAAAPMMFFPPPNAYSSEDETVQTPPSNSSTTTASMATAAAAAPPAVVPVPVLTSPSPSSSSSSPSRSSNVSVGATYVQLSSVIPFDYLTSRDDGWSSSRYKDFDRLHPKVVASLRMLQRCESDLRRQMELEAVLSGVHYTVHGRLKSLHSMQCKMRRKQVGLEGVYDARALRVVLDDQRMGEQNPQGQAQVLQGCYSILSVVHRLWRPIPSEFDDYIAHPKATGYQSLHTSVVGPDGSPLEIQIRTRSMHEMAEYGAAAHWVYKDITLPAGQMPSSPTTTSFSSPQHAAARDHTGGGGVSDGRGRRKKGEGKWFLQARVGAGALRMDREGRAEDAVVVSLHQDGTRILAVSTRGAAAVAFNHGQDKYKKMLEEVNVREWKTAGQGCSNLIMEEFVLCSDQRYHLRDAYGVKHSECTLNILDPATSDASSPTTTSSVSSLLATPTSTITRTSSEQQLDDKVRILRAMLEWEAELLGTSKFQDSEFSINSSDSKGSAEEPTSTSPMISRASAISASPSAPSSQLSDRVNSIKDSDEPPATYKLRKRDENFASANFNILRGLASARTEPDVTVMTWPDGKVLRLPSGSTVEDLYDGELSADDKLRVNNNKVTPDTLLQDGDFIIMQEDSFA